MPYYIDLFGMPITLPNGVPSTPLLAYYARCANSAKGDKSWHTMADHSHYWLADIDTPPLPRISRHTPIGPPITFPT
jgi:hypothetical protein